MNHSLHHTVRVAAATACLLAGTAFAQPALQTEKDRISYTVGMDVARMIEPIHDEVDIDVVLRAIRETLAGQTPALSPEEADTVREGFSRRLQERHAGQQRELAESNRREGAEFLAANRGRDGVQVTESGLQYEVIRAGSGARPTAASTVRVHYAGTLLDGTTFDSSYERGEPAQFPLANVIPGWTEGLQLMQPGAKYRFWIPSDLAYGDRQNPGPIGPNATLVFEVELLEVVE